MVIDTRYESGRKGRAKVKAKMEAKVKIKVKVEIKVDQTKEIGATHKLTAGSKESTSRKEIDTEDGGERRPSVVRVGVLYNPPGTNSSLGSDTLSGVRPLVMQRYARTGNPHAWRRLHRRAKCRDTGMVLSDQTNDFQQEASLRQGAEERRGAVITAMLKVGSVEERETVNRIGHNKRSASCTSECAYSCPGAMGATCGAGGSDIPACEVDCNPCGSTCGDGLGPLGASL
jgi:hypothetical protein